MRIAIIGCGYIGRAVATYWKGHHHVTVTTRDQEKVEDLSLIADEVFLLSDSRMKDFATLAKKNDALVLLAAPTQADQYRETYLENAQALSAVLTGTSVQHLLYSSSTSVYGENQGKWVDENSLPHPLNPQAEILIQSEELLLALDSPSLKVCIFRLGEIFGPGRTLADRLKNLQGKTLPGSGMAYSNRIHQEDVVRALDFALENNLSGVYSLCHDEHPSRKDLYASVIGLATPNWDPSRQSLHGGNKRVSNQKLKDTGFSFLHSKG